MSDPGATLTAWRLAEWAARLFAVDPAGTGVCIGARPGPQRERWLALLRALLGNRPLRKIPPAITDDRLLGGLDLAATLAAGHPIAERGVLADSDGGAILIPCAERLSPTLAARIAAVHDSGEIRLRRDGLTRHLPARFGLVLIDEGLDADERPPAALLDRIGFRIDLSAVPASEIGDCPLPHDGIAMARARLPEVRVGDEAIEAVCAAGAALGIGSARAALLCLRAAKAAAALDGRGAVAEADLALAARLVLSWRAEALPQGEAEDQPDGRPDQEMQGGEADDSSEPPGDRPLDDIVLAAARAALPPDLLARLIADGAFRQRHGVPGRAGAVRKSGRRGRRAGIARGNPRGGARLDLVATLRAAAPWQRIRRQALETASPPMSREPPAYCGAARHGEAEAARQSGRARGIRIRASDFRIVRFAERRETLTIFAVDASGSQALNRLAEAKGAVELLLADCYIRRDQVALIAFRGRRSDLLLPPTRSLVRAKRCLSGLPGGGGTPIASGIDAAAALAQSALRRGQTPLIVMLTDGRANVARSGEPGRPRAQADAMASAHALRAGRIKSLLIDTSRQAEPRAEALAAAMGAAYLALPHIEAGFISRAVKGAWASRHV